MNKFHFGTMAEMQKNLKCCDDPCFAEDDRSYPPDDDFYIEYNCINCGKQTIDHYKLVCMEEIMEEKNENRP
jgi:DNA-directed RNA polymerase subunit RPC12/RpoP